MQKLDIKFLSNEEFDSLPITDTLGEDVSDSFGIFNPYTGKIRIRNTGFWDVNKYLLEHELEHAVEEHATDVGPNGLRHKKGKKFFKEIFTPFVTGGLVSGGQRGGLINLGRDENKFDITGLLGPFSGLVQETEGQRNERLAKEQQQSQFGGLGFGPSLSQSGDVSTPSFGSSISPFTDQQSNQTGLNQGLSQQSLNPLADPYQQFGRDARRLYF